MKFMASYRDIFPIDSTSKVVELFKYELEKGNDADLTLLSIVAGFVEDVFTSSRIIHHEDKDEVSKKVNESSLFLENGSKTFNDVKIRPALTYEQLRALHIKFTSVIRGYCDLSLLSENELGTREATRGGVQRVSDILWNTLNEERHTDRAHASNIFSYLTEAKVNCFGLALAVVAGCQVLGYSNVHLVMSEDHSWVVFGDDGEYNMEVTWHERILADRRGQQLSDEDCCESWLYCDGYPVVCNRGTEVAAIVTAVNPATASTNNSQELMLLQKQLFWLLYDKGLLQKYPMALGSLAELEEIYPTASRPSASELYKECMSVNNKVFHGRHIYPYIFCGSWHARQGRSSQALIYWAEAAQVLRFYKYNKEDEEIYKDFHDMNYETIPTLIKNDATCLQDPQCFASLVRFCDGLCSWEEGGSTPVMHVGWTKPLVKYLMAFDFSVRCQVKFVATNKDDNVTKRSPENDAEVYSVYSTKIKELISILQSEKMNMSALQLQLTAQAQSESRRKSETFESQSRIKRTKRV